MMQSISINLSLRSKAYLTLCKPNVVLLMLVTAFIGMVFADPKLRETTTMVLALLGIALCAASAGAVNHLLDAKLDKKMARTAKRPLAIGILNSQQVFIFALTLAISGSLILATFTNWLCLSLTLVSVLAYAIIYTRYLKYATPHNIVIAGLAGAMPPLLGWSAISNDIHPHALLLVLIIFAWTPPHFWSLAIYRRHEYAKAQVPMLPVTHGVKLTSQFILLYCILLFLVCLLPVLSGFSGLLYLLASLCLNLGFLYWAYKLFIDQENKTAKRCFDYSLIHLSALFGIMLIDLYWPLTGSL